MFNIDWNVNLGDIIQIGAILAAGVSIFFGMRTDIYGLRYDIGHIKEQQKALNEAFHQLGKILTQVAVQDTRMSMMEKAIDEMRHGQGFINRIDNG